MTSKRPIPLKDEPVTPLDELQELLAANLAATEALNKKLNGYSGTQSIDTETLKKSIATAARNAVKELLEERQRNFEQEEQEAKARGALTPQECYAKLSADYADVLQKCIIVCDAYKYIKEAAKRQETHSRRVEAKLDALIAKQDIQAARVTKTTFPSRPKRLKDLFAYLFKDIPLYCLRRACRSRPLQRFVRICLLCIWLITIATACFIAHDNAVLRKEAQHNRLHQKNPESALGTKNVNKSIY